MKGMIEGTTLGRYELRRCVARGGDSEVYLGYDHHVRRRVAIKVLYGSDERFVRRFEREALAVGTLSHDHILPLYDFGKQRPWYYLVMPYVDGGTLRDHLWQKGRISLEDAGNFLEQIASALQHAHDHGVVHRDVKPSNILLRPDGHAYLVDFGLAKARMESEASTHAGVIVGTPEYMAPEQTNGLNDYRSDIYALGIILYQMLTGQVPFMADSPVGVTLKHLKLQPQPPSELNKAIPPSIEEVIFKALAKEPDQRFQEASAFAYAYKKALQQERQRRKTIQLSPSLTQETEDAQATGDQLMELPPSPELEAQSPPKAAEQHFVPVLPPSPRFSPGHDTRFLSPIPGTGRTRQRLQQGVLIGLCLLLLTTSIMLSLVWHGHDAKQSRPDSGTPTAAAQQGLTATATSQAQMQATLAAQARVEATAGITSSIGAGKVLYADPLNEVSKGWLNDGRQCYFSAQGYHVSARTLHTVAWCYSSQRQIINAIITAQAQLLRGDVYGLVFRLSPISKAFYVLELNYKGEYRFIRAQGSNPLNWLILIDWTPSSAIQRGYGHINTFLVIASGSEFRFYINQQLIVPLIADNAFASGLLGFLAGGDSSGGTDAVFSNLWVFQK